MNVDNLTNLPVDLLLQQLTYLPFEDVVSVCKSNSKLHNYCTNPKYNNKWRLLIDNTFSGVYNYEDKLKKIWAKLNIPESTYNYAVYTQLINLLDPLTQLMIYYRQGDTKSFNKFSSNEKFWSMFLLNKPEEMKKYKTNFDIKPYKLLLQGKLPSIIILNKILVTMATYGNLKGVKYMIDKGADIHAHNDAALRYASHYGRLEVVRYLVEQGADIHAVDDLAFRWASTYGHLDVIKYLAEQGADIHAVNDSALRFASEFGHLEVVRYLVEQGADIHVYNDLALKLASQKGHFDVVKYLEEQSRN